MPSFRAICLGTVLFAFLAAGAALPRAGAATRGDWPGWRGDGSGLSAETGLPVHWDAQTNVLWCVDLPGEGDSSPIVWGDRVFLTAATDQGAQRHVLCLSTSDGHTLWQRTLDRTRPTKTYPKTGFAAPTPVTDGQRVYAFFDSPGLVALDLAGRVQWTRDLGPFKNSYNMASSPILCDGRLVLCCDQHGKNSFIASFDPATGRTLWKTPRRIRSQYATPLAITVGHDRQLVVNGRTVFAYRPADGQELWRCRGMKPCVAPSAVFDGGLVYVSSGRNGPSMAIDPTGRGDVTETHMRMHFSVGGPYVPSPIVYPYLIVPSDNGTVRLIDRQGRLVLKTRVRGHFTSSPVAGDGKVYWTCEKGDTYVLDTSGATADPPRVAQLAVNRLGERVLASPAIAGGRLYIRTDKHLFCIAGKSRPKASVASTDLTGSFEELKKLYEQNMAPEREIAKVTLRREIVETLGRRDDPRVVPFLKDVAAKDHLDVSEEAVKLLGRHGLAAAPALIELVQMRTWKQYLKIVSAERLGRMKARAAVPALLKVAADRDPLVRMAALTALAEIGRAHRPEVERISPALAAALADTEGVVRRAALDGLASLADRLGDRRESIANTVRPLTKDKNPIVAQAASQALARLEAAPKP